MCKPFLASAWALYNQCFLRSAGTIIYTVRLPTMIVKTQGIVLNIRPWARTSHMVTWLTREYGLTVTSVKGACRPKSAFLGQYDVGYTCDMLFYRREHQGIHSIRECVPAQIREALRANWRAGAAASYFCDLTAAVSVPMQEAEGLYALLAASLDSLCHDTPGHGHLLAFEVALLERLGIFPDLSRCPICHTPEQTWLRFSLASGRLLCAHASPAAVTEPAITLHRDVVAALNNISPATAARLPHSGNLALGIRRFLGMFIRYHLDIYPAARRVAFELLAKPACPTTQKETP